MRISITSTSIVFLIGIAAAHTPDVALAGLVRQSIRNDTGSFANGLLLRFSGPVEQVKFMALSEGGNNATGLLGPTKSTAVFSPGSIGLIPPTEAGGAFIDFETATGGYASLLGGRPSAWTSGDQELGPVTVAGAPMRISFTAEPGGEAFLASATFFNTGTGPVTYSNVALYKDNLNSSYNINQFPLPTGQLVPGLPTSFTLASGESRTLSFGMVDASKYQLALASATEAVNPGYLSRLAAAEMVPVPEPATIIHLGIGALCLIGLGLRRSPGLARVGRAADPDRS